VLLSRKMSRLIPIAVCAALWCALAGRPAAQDTAQFANPLSGPRWNGWGVRTANTRHQDSLSAATGGVHWFFETGAPMRAAIK
jgi:hypothetical protein